MKRSIILLSLLTVSWVNAQEYDSIQESEAIDLEGVNIIEKLPISVQKITKKEINKRNLGQDIPTLMNQATSVVTSTDTGTGIGYSSIRIRGLSERSINVTLNGVPLNDAESQGVFWVNMPDMASSVNAMTIQRGVGTSSNGMAAFGASVNVETQNPSAIPFAELATSFGSFNTQKYTVQAGTGKILNDKLSIDARFSKINSDGYVDRSSSDLISYDVTALFELNDKTKFRFQNMYGRQETYQTWNGVTRSTLESNRTFNSAGAIYNADGSISYYDNQVDNYRQNHYFLSWLQDFGNDWNSNLTLFYRKGKGYYEEYKQDDRLSKYKLDNLGIDKTDLIRRKWLDNDFYGFNLEVENQKLGDFKVFFGIGANEYKGDHFGHVLWMKDYNWTDKDYKFYNNHSTKSQVSAYAKALYNLDKFDFFADLQYRYVNYKADYYPNGENQDDDFEPFSANHNFVNPKAGVNFNLNSKNTFYLAYGISQREPRRTDYENQDATPKSEFLEDYEIGYKKAGRLSFNINGYFMNYKDQLVPSGRLNDVGSPINENIGRSYRLGLELDANYQIIENKLSVLGNLTWSENVNKDYYEIVYDADWNSSLVFHGDTKTALSPQLIAGIGFNAQPIKGFNINWFTKYVSKQYLENTQKANGVLDAYSTTDLLFSYQIPFKKLKNFELSFLVNNLFDKKYESYGYYYEEGFYFPQAGINFLGGIRIRL